MGRLEARIVASVCKVNSVSGQSSRRPKRSGSTRCLLLIGAPWVYVYILYDADGRQHGAHVAFCVGSPRPIRRAPTPQTLPVTGKSAPVMGAPASLARNRMTSASARGVTQVVKSAFGMSARLAGVSMVDGRTALTVMPADFNSSARLSVRRCSADLDAV